MNEPYPGYIDDAKKRDALAARIERAHAAILPGALRDAFAGEPAIVGTARSASSSGGAQTGEGGQTSGAAADSYRLQPVTLGLAANLERIKSPLLDVIRIMRETLSVGDEVTSLKSESASSKDGAGVPASRPEQTSQTLRARLAALDFAEEQIAETVFVFTRPQKRVRQLLDAGRDKFREAVMDELGDKLHPAQMAVLQRACAQHYVRSFATIIGYGAEPPEAGGHEVSFPQPSPGAATDSVGG